MYKLFTVYLFPTSVAAQCWGCFFMLLTQTPDHVIGLKHLLFLVLQAIHPSDLRSRYFKTELWDFSWFVKILKAGKLRQRKLK